MNIKVYKYDVAGVMMNIEDKHDRIYADIDLWIRASDIEILNKQVEEAENNVKGN